MAIMPVAVQSPTTQKCRKPIIRVPIEVQEKTAFPAKRSDTEEQRRRGNCVTVR